jgi:exopolyphosphatase/guanosine-5'-triphosphate,3'-diphosphate pyrophosphatase
MTRVAAIDCGTNTVLLTIAEIADGAVRPLREEAEITRLGEGLAATGRIADVAVQRTLAVFARYAAVIEEARCDRVLAVATEALRRATNGTDVVARLEAALARVGGRLEIIDGRREASLSFAAVRGSFPALQGVRTVVDIGGGSTELVVGDAQIDAVISLPIGSVVLTERHVAHDPPTLAERDALVAEIDRALDSAPRPVGTIVGIAGTVTTYAAIALGLTDYDATLVHGHRLARATLDREVTRLGALALADRRRTPGLSPKRADVIWAGGLVLSRILARADAEDCVVSDRGIRWGLLYEAAEVAEAGG